MAITKSRKTVSIGGKNYKEGSKAASGAISAGGTVSKDAGTIRANANASKARTAALSAADPLTVADNMGIDTPDRIEADEMAGVVEDLASKGAVAKPLPAAQAAAVAPVAPPASGTPAGVSPPPTPTQSRYQTGLSTLQNSGIPAPSDAGAARMQLASAVPQAPEDTTAVDNFISEDPAINGLMANIAALLNPQNQTTSLMQDYKKLYKQSGLDEINEELIDAETVIDGTEDDIRNEIQTAGGLATDSQVQAMSLARNKGLLKRYNQLVQMKTDATNQLNTLVQLNGQDKQIAQQRIDSQISAMFNMANFRQNATNNTRQQYQWMASQMGADGLYNSLSQDPRQLAFAEKILGTGPGGLQKLAATAAQDRARQMQMQDLDMAAKRADIANTQSQIAARTAEANGLTGGYSLSTGGILIPYNGKLTNQEQAKIRDIEVGEKLVDQFERLYKNAIKSTPGSSQTGINARAAGFGRVLGAAFGTNQAYREYQNFVDSNLTPIAKGLKGEVGAVTKSDTDNAKKALPGAFTSTAEAQAAFANLRQQLRDQKTTYGEIGFDDGNGNIIVPR